MDPLIDVRAAHALRLMIVSCGSVGCFEAMSRLESITAPTPLSKIGLAEDGSWLMSVFQRLQWYAKDYGVSTFTAADVVRYFGGTLHIDIMERIADHAGLGQYLGRDVGLVTHSLLPLAGETYANEGHMVSFKGAIELNSGDSGKRFYHLGAIVKIAVSDRVIQEILLEQSSSKPFMQALGRIDGQTVGLPSEYQESLNCTAVKASTKKGDRA